MRVGYQVVERNFVVCQLLSPQAAGIVDSVAAFLFHEWLGYEKEEAQAQNSRYGTLELSGGLLERTDLSVGAVGCRKERRNYQTG